MEEKKLQENDGQQEEKKTGKINGEKEENGSGGEMDKLLYWSFACVIALVIALSMYNSFCVPEDQRKPTFKMQQDKIQQEKAKSEQPQNGSAAQSGDPEQQPGSEGEK